MFETKKSILQEIVLQELKDYSIQLFIKRDDLIDEVISGNKWRKLKYNILQAQQLKKTGILTFGGSYSNHLIATAAACQMAGLRSIGIVRGDELNYESNDTLKHCTKLDMELIFVSRDEYSLRNEKSYHEQLNYTYSNFYIVPEGGCNYYGIVGCQEIMQETPNEFDHVFVAQGTTTTSLGVAFSLNQKSLLHVVPVLKGFDSVAEMKSICLQSGIEKSLYENIVNRIDVLPAYHFGGYGKYTNELLDFMERFFQETNIPLDPVYTGKALYALVDWVKKNNILNAKILFIHTGGMQGGRDIEKKEGRTFS